MEGTTGRYRGYLIVEHPEGTVKAYRYPEAYWTGIPSYTSASLSEVYAAIDIADDYGGFSEEEYQELVKEPGRYEVLTPEKEAEIARFMSTNSGSVARAVYEHGLITYDEQDTFAQAISNIAAGWLKGQP